MIDMDFFKFKADLRDSTPVYLQLARHLETCIREGQFQPEQALPSERQLALDMRVSRATARAAIDQLVAQDLVLRKRGSGNYVASQFAPRLEQGLSQLTSFSEELRRRGYTPSSKWLQRAIVAPSCEQQLSLGLSSGAKVARLERLRLADGVVMAYEVSVLPQSVLPAPMKVTTSLYDYLKQHQKVPVRALQHIRAINAPAKLAQRLNIAERQAVLFITRLGYLPSGQAAELTYSYCRSDYYDFVAEMRRE